MDLPHFADSELICVVGPTATQKTELAIRLCEQLDGEVVSADSVQVYEHFDIGTGKPTDRELGRARHHLIGCVDPMVHMDASRFAAMADERVQDIQARGKRPIVCGGTFLWIRALVWGLADAPPADAATRAELSAFASEHGVPALHARLVQVDAITAARVSPNDYVRIERALEVAQLSGKPLSAWHADHQARGPRFQAKLVGIAWDKGALEERIRLRVRGWLLEGWEDHVRDLVARGYGNARAMGSVGFKQIRERMDGAPRDVDLETAIVRATKIYARRQRTWLRDAPVLWLPPLN